MSFTKFSITNDLLSLMISNSGLTQMVNDNIFPVIAPEDVTGDMILFYRDQYGKEYTKMGIYNEYCKVIIAIVSENYDRSIQLCEMINIIIEGTHKNINELEYECRLVDSTEDFEDKKYIQILVFEIK